MARKALKRKRRPPKVDVGGWKFIWVSDSLGRAAPSLEDELRKRLVVMWRPRLEDMLVPPQGALFFDDGPDACLRMGYLIGSVYVQKTRPPVVYVPGGEGTFLFDQWRELFGVKPEVLGSLTAPVLARRISNKLRRARP